MIFLKRWLDLTKICGVYAKKLEVGQKRKEYRKHNQSFKYYRNSLYRHLGDLKKLAIR